MRGIRVDGNRLRQIRRARCLTQLELASLAGVGERTVRNAEMGRRVRLDFLNYLASALGCDLLDLVDNRDELRTALREQRRVDLILQAIAVLSDRGDGSEYLDLIARDVRVSCPGPDGLSLCGEYRGSDGVQVLLDRSVSTIAYDSAPKILDIRTGGNLVVINGVDFLTAIPTGKSFSTPWMHVYEFDDGHIARTDIWADIGVIQDAFQPG
jgi:transcriptional regulator with XRE-family HTH domain